MKKNAFWSIKVPATRRGGVRGLREVAKRFHGFQWGLMGEGGEQGERFMGLMVFYGV